MFRRAENHKTFRRFPQRRSSGAIARSMASALEPLEQRICMSVGYGAPTDFTAAGLADFVAAADFDNDGKQDLVVSSYDASSLTVFFGDGAGDFSNYLDIALTSAPDFVTAGDLNNDGKADLVTASYDDNVVTVLLGNGDGTFASGVNYAAGTGGRAVALGDFTGDGKLDIAVAKSFDTNLTILKNNGNGTFMAPVNSSLGFAPTDLATGDFNGDGNLDLVAASFFTDKVAVLLGNGNGTFATAVTYDTGAGPTAVAVSDIDSDGALDVLTANLLDNTLSVLLGNGDGTLCTHTDFATGNGPTFVAAADLDSDGNVDLVTVDGSADTYSIFWGVGNAVFYPAASHAAQSAPRSLVIGSFDGVGGLDLAIANQGIGTVSVVMGGAVETMPPLAIPDGPYTVNEGATISLAGPDSIGTGLTYTWDLDGDGIFGETGAGATRGNESGAAVTFSAAGLDGPGSFVVSLRVRDVNGVTSTTPATISITNVAPTLSITGSNAVAEGSSYMLNLTSSDPGVDTITQWIINWGDGSTQTVQGHPSTVSHVFADDGAYTISASATDEDGSYDAGTCKTLSVTNVAPSLTLGGGAAVDSGSTYTLSLGASDPGTDSVTGWTINWGDGVVDTVNGNPSTVTHLFSGDTRTVTIAATATDEDGSYDSAAKLLGIKGATPLANAGGPYSVNEEGTMALDGSKSLGLGSLTYEWDLDGDGIFGEIGTGAKRGNETGLTPTFSAAGLNGPTTYQIAVRVTNQNDQSDTATATINIKNVVPVLSISGGTTATAGKAYTLTLSAAYVGADPITKWVIKWGDGTSQTIKGSPSSVTKIYSTAGARTITATASDADGTYSAKSKSITVSAPIAPDAAGNSSAAARNLGTFKAGTVKAVADNVGPSDRNDYYKFAITSTLTIAAKLSNLTDNVDLMLLNSSGTRLAYSKHTGTSVERFTKTLKAGTYYIRVLSSGTTSTPYRLRIDVTTPVTKVQSLPPLIASAPYLGSFAAGTVKTITDSVSATSSDDYFRFALGSAQHLYLKLSNLSANANLELLDSAGKVIRSSARSGTNDEPVQIDLASGTYYAHVLLAQASSTGYRLRFATS
jgi:hypothetical protein